MFINLGLTFPNGSILQLCCSSKKNICVSKEKPKTLGNRSLDRKFMMAHLKLPKNNPGAAQNRRFKTANLDQEKILALHFLHDWKACSATRVTKITAIRSSANFLRRSLLMGKKPAMSRTCRTAVDSILDLPYFRNFNKNIALKKTEALPANVYTCLHHYGIPVGLFWFPKRSTRGSFSKGFCIFTGRYPRKKHPYFVQGCTHIQPIGKNDDGPWGIELRWDAPNPAKLYNSFMAGMIPQVVIFQHFFSISQVRRFVANPKIFPSLQEVILSWLVVLTILKNMKVNGKDHILWKITHISKPPTSVHWNRHGWGECPVKPLRRIEIATAGAGMMKPGSVGPVERYIEHVLNRLQLKTWAS